MSLSIAHCLVTWFQVTWFLLNVGLTSMTQLQLHIPAFTKGLTQLEGIAVEQTRNTANVRIHVERVID